MANELTKQEQTYELSAGVFTSIANFKELYDIGKMFASSTLVPHNYQNKPMDCAIAVDIANRIGVSPMMVMQNLYVVQGRPSWSGQACMSMINASPKFKKAKPVYFGEKGTDERGCRIEAIDAETGKVIVGPDVTIKMAKDEGWYNKTGSKWRTIPELMLAYRAAAFFARIHIPNALMGFYVEGEVEDITGKEKQEAVDIFGGSQKDSEPKQLKLEGLDDTNK